MFSNAKNVVISGGTFNTILQGFHSHHAVNDATVTKERRQLIAVERLQQQIAPGAFHNSDERHDPPKCHPQTRRAVLKKIEVWVKALNKVALVLWLYGPAGAGKSAIAQTIAELFENLGLLAAAFFFSRNAAGRNNKTPLIATLVYQLIKSIPEIRDRVLEVVFEDPAIFSLSIQSQVGALIVKPLNAAAIDGTLAPTLVSRPRLIILDGLDECHSTSAQTHILNALFTAVRNLNLPFCFLIACRPERHIRDAFNDQIHGLGSLSFSIALDNTYQPDRDIQTFLQSAIDEVKRKHPSGGAHFPALWPTAEDLRRLIEKSSGQFIFASTVVKYLKSHRHWPPDRLKIILGAPKPDQETPFAELDCLYRFILSSVTVDVEKVKHVLGFLALNPLGGEWPQTTAIIERFLFYRPGEIHMILSDLHSIISVPSPEDRFGELQFFHASLPDFLLDRSRSADFFLNQGSMYAKFAELILNHFNNSIKFPMPTEQTYLHRKFRVCCVKACLSPRLLQGLCGLNLEAHFTHLSPKPYVGLHWRPDNAGSHLFQDLDHILDVLELMCWFERQRLSPNSTETLLDHHFATFNEWLQAQLSDTVLSYYLIIISLGEQANFDLDWQSTICLLLGETGSQADFLPLNVIKYTMLFEGRKSQLASSQILSKFLRDPHRARKFNIPISYLGLTENIIKILQNQRYFDGPIASGMAFKLLPTLLSRLTALGGYAMRRIANHLQCRPPLVHSIKHDSLKPEEVKVVHAIEDFLTEASAIFMHSHNLPSPAPKNI